MSHTKYVLYYRIYMFLKVLHNLNFTNLIVFCFFMWSKTTKRCFFNKHNWQNSGMSKRRPSSINFCLKNNFEFLNRCSHSGFGHYLNCLRSKYTSSILSTQVATYFNIPPMCMVLLILKKKFSPIFDMYILLILQTITKVMWGISWLAWSDLWKCFW